MPQNYRTRKLLNTDIRPAFYAHLVTAWFVFGGYLLYSVCFLPPEHWVKLLSATSLFYSALLLLFSPLLIVGGLGYAVSLAEQQKYELLIAVTAAMLGYFLLWHGIWRAMYGKQGLFTYPMP